MDKKRNILVLFFLFMLSGCQAHESEDTSPGTSYALDAEAPFPLTSIDSYRSLSELKAAFSIASTSNTRSVFPNEKIYYLADDNPFGLSLKNINVRESYFNCVYDDEILLITNRVEDGNVNLELMINNNPEIFTKMEEGNLEYYYMQENGWNYYFWIQDGHSLQLNIPAASTFVFHDFIDNLEYEEID